MNYGIKYKFVIILKCIIRLVLPVALIVTSVTFINETKETSNTQEEMIMHKIIEYILLGLDFIAAIIIINNLKNLLYDLEIINEKEHKIKIKN